MLLKKGPNYFPKPRGRPKDPGSWSRVPQRAVTPVGGAGAALNPA